MSDSLKNVSLAGIGLLSTLHPMHCVGNAGVEIRGLPEEEKAKIGDLPKGIPARMQAGTQRLSM